MKTIAVIDDDIHIGNLVEEVLNKEGYQVMRAYSGTEAVMLLSQNTPDLVLLDLMLPGLSGEEVLPHIKDIPVIVVSAKVDVQDKVSLLMNGAADYITKPFDMSELLARVAVQLRRSSVSEPKDVLSANGLVLSLTSHSVAAADQIVHLTRTEFAILKLLIQNPDQVIARSILLDNICEDTPDCTENSLRQHVSNLRKKLRDASGKEYIEAIWGIGFRLGG